MTKHTKGPWKVLYSSNKYPSIHSGPTQTPVAVLYEYVSETDRDLLDNAEANARLIAAAPELLAWLKFIKDAYSLDEYTQAELSELIAKAEGGAE